MSVATNQSYEDLRPYLFTVAYRLTGSASEAEDLIQDAWVRYLDAGSPGVESLRAYLTTIISRLSLDYLKSARARREQYVGPWLPEPAMTGSGGRNGSDDPAIIVERADDVSMALLVLLDRLTPDQRVVYVLRESLCLPFEIIAAHIGRSVTASRQTFHRARQRMTDESMPTTRAVSPALARRFLHALEQADAARLASLLSTDVVWVSDGGQARAAARNPILGADRVSRGLAGIVSRFGDSHQRFTIEELNGEPGIIIWQGNAISTVIQWQASGDYIGTLWFSRNPVKLAHVARQLGTTIGR